jgi:hypothetical protein
MPRAFARQKKEFHAKARRRRARLARNPSTFFAPCALHACRREGAKGEAVAFGQIADVRLRVFA